MPIVFQPGTLARGRILGARWELFENRADQMEASAAGGLVGSSLLADPVPGHQPNNSPLSDKRNIVGR